MSDDRKGWRISSARTIYDNPWLRLRSYKAAAPTGKDCEYGLVSFKKLAVGVLPLFADGATLLVGQHRFTTGRYSWELPEGGGEMTEPPLDTARRELAEETGYGAGAWSPLLADLHLSNSVTDERAFAYLAWDLVPNDEHAPDETESLNLRRLPVGEAVHMAVSGTITDAFTLAMLLKADHLWRTGQLPQELADAFRAGQI